jgi:hypothetical protein
MLLEGVFLNSYFHTASDTETQTAILKVTKKKLKYRETCHSMYTEYFRLSVDIIACK